MISVEVRVWCSEEAWLWDLTEEQKPLDTADTS